MEYSMEQQVWIDSQIARGVKIHDLRKTYKKEFDAPMTNAQIVFLAIKNDGTVSNCAYEMTWQTYADRFCEYRKRGLLDNKSKEKKPHTVH